MYLLFDCFVFAGSKMGLDLIPRINGEVLDADSTSVVELYNVVRAA
jgi:hypothetical protein